ncbi:MAG: hypothetical protein ACI8UG_001738 [Gammaproteobacteria bacterium]
MKQPVCPRAHYAESLHSIDESADYLRKTDTSLMLHYSAGVLQAFETLYNRHKGGLYRHFIRHISEPSLAEYLYQDIWKS